MAAVLADTEYLNFHVLCLVSLDENINYWES